MCRILFLLILASSIGGCAVSSKASKEQPAPQWTQSRPQQTAYYIGIGKASKTKADYMQTAKQNALADLASDISVVISSQSVISTIQLQNNYFSEDFMSTIRAEVQKELEDYEIVDTWENAQEYWVFCRLSKESYKKKMEEKKAAIANIALDYYVKALKADSANDSKTALLMLIKGLETIKPYFTEDVKATYSGKPIFLGNEIIMQLSAILNNLIVLGPTVHTVRLGQTVTSNNLTYCIKNSNGIPQKAIPLKISYSGWPVNKNITTNHIGEASFSIDPAVSRKKTETIRIEIDFESIIKEASRDVAVSFALSRTKTPYIETRLTIMYPKFYVTSDETNLGKSMAAKPLAEKFKQELLKIGFPITDKPEDADYKISITAHTSVAGQSQQYVQVSLNLNIAVTNRDSEIVFSYSNDKLTGSHFEATKAGEKAFTEASKRIDSSIFNDLVTRIINTGKPY